MGSAVMTIRVLLSLCVLSVTVWARPYSGEDDDAFANLIQEIEAEGQAEGLSESDLGDLEDFESIELVEDPGLMLEVSMSELANLRMLLEEAMDALANVVDSGMGMGDLIEKP